MEGTAGNILIIDDDPVTCSFVEQVLHQSGYHTVSVHNPVEAYTQVECNGASFDLVLLDVIMPDINGFDFCRKIRHHYSQNELPVIMLTSKEGDENILQGIEAGANDYLIKPVNSKILTAKVKSQISIKKFHTEKRDYLSMKRDIEIAHEIQNKILEKNHPVFNGMKISTQYIPAYKIGGDFFEILKISETEAVIIIADVSGHGVSAALLCSMLKMAFISAAEKELKPSKLLSILNSLMHRYLDSNFVTAACVHIDIEKKTLSAANAGHWPVLVQDRNSGEIAYDLLNGIPIGWQNEPLYTEKTYNITSQSRIMLFTDYAVEAKNSSDKQFGFERLLNFIQSNSCITAAKLSEEIVKTLQNWSGSGKCTSFPDDLTMIVCDFF